MLFEQFEVKGLAHYSYAVGCERAERVAVVDPKRDVDAYLDYARRAGATITHVLETHIHADYASGALELAQRSGARLFASAHDRGERYQARYGHQDLHDGEEIAIGAVRLRALHTPGHTPEHLSFLVHDGGDSAERPAMLLSGDFLFAGSLGRPDLLGEDEKLRLAKMLHESVRDRLSGLPDELRVYPAHGAGSMCGAGLAARAFTTLGAERAANPYLDPSLSAEQFVDKILGSVPPFPPYYRRMKELNSIGPPPLAELPSPEPIEAAGFLVRMEQGHAVVDVRDPDSFGEGHVPGSLSVCLTPNFSSWAAWVVPYDTPLMLVADATDRIDEVRRGLARVGLDDVRGWLAGGFATWPAAGFPVHATAQISPQALHERLRTGDGPAVLDVRGKGEFDAGHIAGATSIMFGELADRLEAVPSKRPVAVVCGGGMRSTIAASVLERAGIDDVLNVSGGMGAWRKAGLPTTDRA
jgi:hydroxyacylglutathione hydrolase